MSIFNFELSLVDMLSDKIYTSGKTKRNWDIYMYPDEIYLIMKDELNCYYIFFEDWNGNLLHYENNVKQVMQISKYKIFSIVDHNLPLYFIALTLLFENFMPKNFRDYALSFLKWFDLDKYNMMYELSLDEFSILKYDLKKALYILNNCNEMCLVE